MVTTSKLVIIYNVCMLESLSGVVWQLVASFQKIVNHFLKVTMQTLRSFEVLECGLDLCILVEM